jgi:shikimate kinase
MRPEGSCRKVGVTYNEVVLPSIKMHNMCPSYDRPWHRARSYPPARVFSKAPLQRVAARPVERRRVDVQRWIKPVDSIRPQSTCVRRLCGELSRRPARIIYDCRAARNGTTLIEHCCMLIFLAGVSCVGKTTIGAQLAGLLECRFFDLDIETERFFETSIERLRNRHLTSPDFQLAASQALKHVFSREDSYNWVIALPPSGLLGGYWKVVNERRNATIVVLRDTPENILKRITFYDIDSRPLHECLTDRERGFYLREIVRDIA